MILNVLIAGLISQVVSKSTVSVVDTVLAIDTVHKVFGVAYIVIVCSGGRSKLSKGILHGL